MWARVAASLAGVWLMAAPSALGYAGAARISDLIVGPIAASVAIVAMSEVTRAVRWATLPLGCWAIVSPWLLGSPPAARVSGLVAGAVLAASALARGRRSAQFGGGWRALRRPGHA
jgi:hypothetical protein